MTQHPHPRPGERPAFAASILHVGAGTRVAIALALSTLLWLGVYWALT